MGGISGIGSAIARSKEVGLGTMMEGVGGKGRVDFIGDVDKRGFNGIGCGEWVGLYVVLGVWCRLCRWGCQCGCLGFDWGSNMLCTFMDEGCSTDQGCEVGN